jgi:hypothetical protein
MQLRQAIDLVLNEAESSALGDGNNEVLEAVTLLHDFLDWVADDVKMWDKYNEGVIAYNHFLMTMKRCTILMN